MKILKKYSIKIPKNVKVIYAYDKNFITLIGPLGKKSLKLKLILKESTNCFYVTKLSNSTLKNKKSLKSLQGTITALLIQTLLEISVLVYKKLKLVGVGYKIFLIENYANAILEFKLGFSHPVFINVNRKIQTFLIKSTSLYIFGNSYSEVNLFASSIRSYKKPEPYKGKGILYQNEKIKLKEGKKI